MLYFSFKICYLCSRKQQADLQGGTATGCELLSKFVIFAVANNRYAARDDAVSVVNCFQNLLSLQSQTTQTLARLGRHLL